MNDSLANKIAALLAKAEGTDNEHERDAFSAAAERLMLKWGVDDAMAAAAAAGKNSVPASKMATRFLTWPSTYYTAWIQLTLQLKLGLDNVMIIKHGNLRVSVLGTEGDVDRFVQLFDSIQAQATRAMNAWWKNYQKDSWDNTSDWMIRRQFLLSFGKVVGSRLWAERRTIVTETVGSELVLVDQKAAVDRYVSEQFPRLQAGRASRMGSGGHAAREAGRAAGNRASLGARTAVTR